MDNLAAFLLENQLHLKLHGLFLLCVVLVVESLQPLSQLLDFVLQGRILMLLSLRNSFHLLLLCFRIHVHEHLREVVKRFAPLCKDVLVGEFEEANVALKTLRDQVAPFLADD